MPRWPVVTSLLLLSSQLASAQIVAKRDITHEEEEEIRERLEWFYGPRGMMRGKEDARAHEYGAIRAQAALDVAKRVQAQKSSLRAPSIWTNIGPAPIFNTSLAGPDTGRITGLAIHPTNPNIMYLGSAAGGLWKTTDGGVSWTSLFETMPTQTIGAVAIAPTDVNTIWVGTGDYNTDSTFPYFGMGVYRSTDAGATWELRNGTAAAPMELSDASSVILHPTDPSVVIIGGTLIRNSGGASEGGIYRTTDAGLTWAKAFDRTTNEIVRHPGNPAILWGARRGSSTGPQFGAIKSTDGGATWLDSNTGLVVGGSRTEIDVAPSDPNILYFLSENTDLYKSTDGGTTWALANANACEGQCWYNMTMKVAANDPNTIYIGTIRPFKSTNGGGTLTALSNYGQKLHPDVQHMERHPTDPNTIFVGTDGGLWKTTDGGTTFTNLNGNLNLTQYYHIAVHPTSDLVALAGSQDNGHNKYSGTPDWRPTAPTGDGMYCGIHPLDPTYWFAGTYPGATTNVYRSTNSGLNWIKVTSEVNEGSAWVAPFIFDPVNPDTMYLGARGVWRSTNRGFDWTKISPNFQTFIRTLAVAPSNNQIVYAGAGTALWRSTDTGANWTNVTGNLPGRTITDLAIDQTDPNHVYATVMAFYNTSLYITTTGGGSWTGVTNGLPPVPAESVLRLTNPLRIYVGTDVGIFVADNDAGPFVPDMNGFAQGVPISELVYSPALNTITAGTYGRGAWKKDAGAPLAASFLVGKGNSSNAAHDSRINGYRSDGLKITAIEFLSFTGTGHGVNTTGGDVTGEGQAEILAGQGPGPTHPPVGKIFTNTGVPLAGGTMAAYGGSGYGLNMVGGDIDADQMDELVTGPGEGVVYGPQVRAWNYDNSGAVSAIAKVNFYAYGTLKYGTNVGTSSFDADAIYKEILSGAGPGDVFGPHVRGWNFDGSTITAAAKVNFFAYSTLKFGVNVGGGDVDRDGFDELVTGPGPGPVFGAQVRGFNVDAGTAQAMTKINYVAYGAGRYGVNVTAGDVDADGYGEIATGQGPDPTVTAVLKAWNYDATAIAEITALNKTAWPGLTYGLTVGAGNLGY